jgi:hypothetical protein
LENKLTTQFKYKCDKCDANYLEQRKDAESQFFTNCNACDAGTYVEISSTFLEPDELPVEATTEAILETTPEEI